MAHGGLLGAPYKAVVGLLQWAHGNWPFIDGKCLINNVDLEKLPAPRFVHALVELHIQDSMLEQEFAEHQQRMRGEVMAQLSGYDSTESYGMTNDEVEWGQPLDEPLPYIPPTEQDENGYIGLDPPLN